ncbi:PH domain-containing protein [uncultured Serinicoccus sp.]|uniref:PH domain-containing protein n=1 Tax=uncultured Serinicoccus sp. TaxID=735514 RepID=UPI00342B7D48
MAIDIQEHRGVRAYDGFRAKHVTWAQIEGVQVHSRHDQIVRLRLTQGEHLVLPGVHREDLEEVAHLMATRGRHPA